MPTTPVIDRLLAKVTYDHGCWLWTAAKDPNGYGRLNVGNRSRLAHRVAFELLTRRLDGCESLDHLCRNTSCCNPLHLEPVTHAENMKRSSAGAWQRRKANCPQGHEYTAESTRIKQPGNRRECRQCGRDYEARKVAARKDV